MEQELLQKIKEHDEKLDRIYVSVEKTRKYFLFTLFLSLAAFFLPLLGLVFAVPFFLNMYSSLLQGL